MKRINPLASLSIKHKLSLISIVPTAALVLASVAFVAYDYVAVRNAQILSDRRLADAVGSRSRASVSQGNDRAARQMMATLDRNPNVTRAYIFTADGRVFLKYVHPGVLDTADPPPSGNRRYRRHHRSHRCVPTAEAGFECHRHGLSGVRSR